MPALDRSQFLGGSLAVKAGASSLDALLVFHPKTFWMFALLVARNQMKIPLTNLRSVTEPRIDQTLIDPFLAAQLLAIECSKNVIASDNAPFGTGQRSLEMIVQFVLRQFARCRVGSQMNRRSPALGRCRSRLLFLRSPFAFFFSCFGREL